MDEQTKQALELVAQPVFFAQEGRITWRNATAAGLLAKGTELSSLVEPELLTLWPAESTLHLNVMLAGREYLLSLRRFRDGLLFVGEPQRQSGNDSEQMEATAAQLIDCWFLTTGEAREWRIPNMIYNRPSAELREALASLAPEQAAELEKGLREVWDDPLHADMFPGGYDAKLSAD